MKRYIRSAQDKLNMRPYTSVTIDAQTLPEFFSEVCDYSGGYADDCRRLIYKLAKYADLPECCNGYTPADLSEMCEIWIEEEYGDRM